MVLLSTALITLLRIPIFISFFRKTRINHFTNYYYIWLPAIAVWIEDGICFHFAILKPADYIELIEYFNKSLVDGFFLLKAVLILFAFWKYWTTFTKSMERKKSLQKEEEAQQKVDTTTATLFTISLSDYKFGRMYLTLSIVLSIFVYVIDTFDTMTTKGNLFIYPVLLLWIHELQLFIFLCSSIVNDNDKNKTSFLVFQCFLIILPIHTVYQVMTLLLTKWGFLSAWMNESSFTITFMVLQLFMAQIAIMGKILRVATEGILDWPDFDQEHIVA
ncbi:hypothetical protein BDA99DRAFT_508833 [Phascolomyces articulosus]|uniref:Uncharacterized protein n=1 Tax=Phascolomyces articulosus TaxID=60185 RepID=A0AAD5KBE1_9FUNG|nr:hypothetical protein BDA99DRAFT_508833 [Phascolomyces articulosus]